jgi:hypothetical protein
MQWTRQPSRSAPRRAAAGRRELDPDLLPCRATHDMGPRRRHVNHVVGAQAHPVLSPGATNRRKTLTPFPPEAAVERCETWLQRSSSGPPARAGPSQHEQSIGAGPGSSRTGRTRATYSSYGGAASRRGTRWHLAPRDRGVVAELTSPSRTRFSAWLMGVPAVTQSHVVSNSPQAVTDTLVKTASVTPDLPRNPDAYIPT